MRKSNWNNLATTTVALAVAYIMSISAVQGIAAEQVQGQETKSQTITITNNEQPDIMNEIMREDPKLAADFKAGGRRRGDAIATAAHRMQNLTYDEAVGLRERAKQHKGEPISP